MQTKSSKDAWIKHENKLEQIQNSVRQTQNKINKAETEFRLWAKGEYGKRSNGKIMWSSFKNVKNPAATLQLIHVNQGVKLQRTMSTQELKLYKKLREKETEKQAKIQNKIQKNKIISINNFDEVPL